MHVERSSAAAATTAGSGKRARSAISRWPAFRCCGFVEQGAIAAAAEHATASASSSRHSPGHVVCVRGGAGGLQGRSLQLTSEAGERNSWWRARLARVVQQSTIRPGVLRIEMRKQQKGIFIRESRKCHTVRGTGRRTEPYGTCNVGVSLYVFMACRAERETRRTGGPGSPDGTPPRTAPHPHGRLRPSRASPADAYVATRKQAERNKLYRGSSRSLRLPPTSFAHWKNPQFASRLLLGPSGLWHE